VFDIVPLPLEQHGFQLIRLHGFLPRTDAGAAGGETLRANAPAAKAFFILNHISTADLTGTTHGIASYLSGYNSGFIYILPQMLRPCEPPRSCFVHGFLDFFVL
jgi:hypothetical protein